jgi:hypothetical protein
MDTQIVAVFCLCDDMLKALHHFEDPQSQISDAEVMTTAIIAALYCGGNIAKARVHLCEYGYIPKMLGKSRFNRRFHRVADLFLTLFGLLGETWKALNENSIYVLDSFPVAACDNYRICRCHLYHGKEWRGYQASKKRFFYGLKIHLMITEHGQPVEFFLSPGSYSDTNALKVYFFDLPEGAQVTGDMAYTDYLIEDVMCEANVPLSPLRKKNSTRLVPPWVHYLMSSYRKMVETTGSLIECLLPKHIHAVTARGLKSKSLSLFWLAASTTW